MTGPSEGRLVENIVHFAQALRKAGVKVGTSQVETALRAVEAAGFTRRVDFYHVLRATLISRADHLDVFHQVFSMFWRDPEFLKNLVHLLSPPLGNETKERPADAARRRAEEALEADRTLPEAPPRQQLTPWADQTWSATELFKRMDFEQMSASELQEAEHAVRRLDLQAKLINTRRTRIDPTGRRTDMRATLRSALRKGGEIQTLVRKSTRMRPPDLVTICDISGSMSVYARIMMRFMHAVAHTPRRDLGRVHAFTFGTRLTNVTRALRLADPDRALMAIGQEATDWEGGTRIGEALEQFNRLWSRRLLGSGALVLLITDGLERGDLALLDQEAARLARSARQTVWLNPLLRWDGFTPRAGGMRTLLRHVDSFRACHSLDSLQSLSDVLGQSGPRDTPATGLRAAM
ncbi:MAG: VWA domain-containing protein [Pseudomonadota bacterium]